jgi:hypothetical protein
MIKRYNNLKRLAMYALVGCSFALSAHAQQVKPEVTPRDPSADSAAAMNDTVNDPRIAKSLAGHKGVWKWVVPPVKMAGGFDDHDPIGLIAGKLIPADCSLNWSDPDTHKLYCFTSATSMVYFMNSPHTYLAQAEKNWRVLRGKPSI